MLELKPKRVKEKGKKKEIRKYHKIEYENLSNNLIL